MVALKAREMSEKVIVKDTVTQLHAQKLSEA